MGGSLCAIPSCGVSWPVQCVYLTELLDSDDVMSGRWCGGLVDPVMVIS